LRQESIKTHFKDFRSWLRLNASVKIKNFLLIIPEVLAPFVDFNYPGFILSASQFNALFSFTLFMLQKKGGCFYIHQDKLEIESAMVSNAALKPNKGSVTMIEVCPIANGRSVYVIETTDKCKIL